MLQSANRQPIGRNITLQLLKLASDLHISKPLGIAPKDLFLSRFPYGHPNSILTEWGLNVLPATVYEEGRSVERLILTQSASIRFDLVSWRSHLCSTRKLALAILTQSSKGPSTGMTS